MKLAVAGLWHLGCVTAACLADKGFNVIGIEEDLPAFKRLKEGKLPVYEPGLAEITNSVRNKGLLDYSASLDAVNDADLIWITYDTPVDDKDVADVSYVTDRVRAIFPHIKEGSVVLISSQLPVGTVRALEQEYEILFPQKKVHFAYSPENLRLGTAIKVFNNPDRIIVGVSSDEAKQKLEKILTAISSNIVWMSVPSAEMTKHAINAFLATSVVFINELATLCEYVGADAMEVEKGLKSEERIGPKAYLKAGSAFAGGTLARDLHFLVEKRENIGIPSDFFQSIIESNKNHRDWYKNKIIALIKNVEGKKITVLGLAYKPGTDTLRRSQSIELCKWLNEQGAIVNAFDPLIKSLPAELENKICLFPDIQSSIIDCECIIIATECPEFLEIDFAQIVKLTPATVILDANGFIGKKISSDAYYYRIGKGYETKK